MSKSSKIAVGCLGLAVIAAIIIAPVFQKVHENRIPPRSGCQSNMKQLGLGLIQYEQDDDETLPNSVTADGQGWREAIYPYVKSTGVYRCPSDERDSSHYSPTNLSKSYAANYLGLSANRLARGAFSGLNETPTTLGWQAFPNPDRTIMLADVRGYKGEEWDIISPAFLPDTGRRLYAHFPNHAFYERLPGDLNVLLADGHVKAIAPTATLTPVNLWTRDNAPFTGRDLRNARAILKRAEDE